jgi:hypothetical protein
MQPKPLSSEVENDLPLWKRALLQVAPAILLLWLLLLVVENMAKSTWRKWLQREGKNNVKHKSKTG